MESLRERGLVIKGNRTLGRDRFGPIIVPDWWLPEVVHLDFCLWCAEQAGVSAEPKPCVVCQEPTADRYGAVGWMKETPYCADREACWARKVDRQRARERLRLHPPMPSERDIERARNLAEEMGW